jgi:hypothetical protein
MPAVVGVLLAGAVASATVTFDPTSGTGFVGKGDVQLVFGWNNAQLQANAGNIEFQYSAGSVTESSWTCSRPHPTQERDIVQSRNRTVTSSVQGLIDSMARERNQVTGFILNGWQGEPTVVEETEGPALNSCPAEPSGFTYDEGSTQTTTTNLGGGLQVSNDGSTWHDLQ